MLKSSIKIAFTVLFSVFFTFIHAQEKNYKQIADSLYAKNDYEQVIKLFTKELNNNPKNEQLLRSLGFAYIAQDKLDLGKTYYNKALVVNPNCGNCYANLAKIAVKQGDKEQAKAYFNEGILKDSENISLYLTRAVFHEMEGSNFGAMRDYDKAVKLEPKNTDLYTYRGEYNLRNGYSFLALSDFNKAINLDSTNYEAYFNRSHVYYNQQNYDASIKDINKAIEIEKNNPKFYIGRGAVYARINKNKEAIEDYTKAIALAPDNLNIYYSRSLSYYQLEDLDASCADLHKLEEDLMTNNNIDPSIRQDVKDRLIDYCIISKPSYYYQRGVGFYNLKQFQKAVDIYTEGLSHFPNNSMMLSFKGNAYFKLKNYTKAIENYDLAIKNKNNYINEVKNNPNFKNKGEGTINNYVKIAVSEIHFSKSESYFRMGNYRKALTAINIALEEESALQDFPDYFARFYYQRGCIHLAENHFELAFNDFEHSMNLNARDVTVYLKYIIAQINLLDDVKIKSFEVGKDIDKQDFKITWELQNGKLSTTSEIKLKDALELCNHVLVNKDDYGFAYYIRAKVKQLLQQDDYCVDYKKAKELGLFVEKKMIGKCK